MTNERKRTKRVMLALEKLFAAEVDSAFNNLPPIAQIGADVAMRLVVEGLAEAVEATLPGRLPVTVAGDGERVRADGQGTHSLLYGVQG